MRKFVLISLLALACAIVVPGSRGEPVPLSAITLVAEQSTPPAELAAATRNSNGGPNNHGGHGGSGCAQSAIKWSWLSARPKRSEDGARQLVAVAIR